MFRSLPGKFRQGKFRQGKFRQGKFRQGKFRQGKFRQPLGSRGRLTGSAVLSGPLCVWGHNQDLLSETSKFWSGLTSTVSGEAALSTLPADLILIVQVTCAQIRKIEDGQQLLEPCLSPRWLDVTGSRGVLERACWLHSAPLPVPTPKETARSLVRPRKCKLQESSIQQQGSSGMCFEDAFRGAAWVKSNPGVLQGDGGSCSAGG